MTTYSLSTYQQLAERLAALEKWLLEFGIRAGPTRIGHYQRTIDRLIVAQTAGTIYDTFTKEQVASIILSFGEIAELEFVRQHLANGPDIGLAEKLAAIVGGPVLPSAEDPNKSSNHARNILFELTVAATLGSSSFPLLPAGICDLCTSFRGKRVIIECKRPQYATKVERAVKDGMRQLKKHLGPNPKQGFGLLALSASKVITAGTKMIRAPNKEGIQEELLSAGDEFIQSHRLSWSRQVPKGVIAMILHLGATGVAEASGQLYTGKQYFFCAIGRQPEDRVDLARAFFAQFQSGSIR